MLTKEKIATVRRHLKLDSRWPLIFSVLGDQGRFRIFMLFADYPEFCVTDIARILGISIPAASQQLRTLEMVGLVQRERMGKMICYALRKDDPVVDAIIKMLK